jgi:hypothetical protein
MMFYNIYFFVHTSGLRLENGRPYVETSVRCRRGRSQWSPGIDFIKLHFGRKTFQINFGHVSMQKQLT